MNVLTDCEATTNETVEPSVGAIMPAAEEPIRVLIAEDEPTVRGLLADLLNAQEGKYRVDLAVDGEEALKKLRSHAPDLLITDLKMPRLSGEDLTKSALEARPDLTVLVITGNGTVNGAVRMMKDGVFDFITKPFQIADLTAVVDRAARRIRAAAEGDEESEVITALLTTLETKDPYLKYHSTRVGRMAHKLALAVGLSQRQARLIRKAATVHDVGKIGIPDAILSKPGPLTPDEFDEVKKHPGRSVRIIQSLSSFRECIPAIYHHHEWYNGSGYPERIAGPAIPLGARVISICDAYDAMASNRTYRVALPDEVIRRTLLDSRGGQFDGDLVEVFLRIFTR